ncbi:MAG: hypothetical protein HYY13_03680 [Nitrospirae bacterium]|nr:hypothetical protein [Nitrospirota bacterium]
MDVFERLAKIEEDLRVLGRDYDQYFAGGLKTEPFALLSRVEREIQTLSVDPTLNTAQRFKLNTIMARFHVNKTRWQKILRQREQLAD